MRRRCPLYIDWQCNRSILATTCVKQSSFYEIEFIQSSREAYGVKYHIICFKTGTGTEFNTLNAEEGHALSYIMGQIQFT